MKCSDSANCKLPHDRVVKATYEYLYNTDKDHLYHGVHLCNQWRLHERFNVQEVCWYFVQNMYMDMIRSFVGCDSSMPLEMRVVHQRELVDSLKNQHQINKVFKQIDVKIEEFPRLVTNQIFASVQYQANQPQSVLRVEQLFKDMTPCLAILCSIYCQKKNTEWKAMGIYVRNKLTLCDFQLPGMDLSKNAKKIETMIHKKNNLDQFMAEIDDQFAPVSVPLENHIALPKDV